MPVGLDQSETPILSQHLLLGVAEELKLPLIQIARLAEQAQALPELSQKANNSIQATADSALQLLDNYVLGIRLKLEPQLFQQETVSVASVLYDTGEQLSGLAKSYGVELELNVAGRYGPVSANRQALQAALASLGAALIEAMPAIDQGKKRQLCLQLATHRSRYGIVAGVYADTSQVSASALRSGRKLGLTTRQPLINFSHTSGAGIFVAETILKAMNLSMTASRHHSLYGIATILQPNNQLQLI
jgi:hypothetical protein